MLPWELHEMGLAVEKCWAAFSNCMVARRAFRW